MKLMTYETLRYFAYSNDAIVEGDIKGIVVDFKGLGFSEMMEAHTCRGVELAGKGIVYIIPYYNPWNWMNAQAVMYTDEIIEVIENHYGLDDVPVVACGGSMGGLCALIYIKYAAVTPVACVANCPVCDLVFHYTERPDLPRTLYSAFGMSGAATIEEAMAERSPLHQADVMPDVKYTVFHCDADEAVNIRSHSDKFVSKMAEKHDITYHIVPGRGHCDLDDEHRALYNAAVENAILEKA